jgi:hypothetical protein
MAKKTQSILEEALLEAKTIKEIALESAKQKIYESQDSYLRNNLAEKLEELDYEDTRMDEEIDLSELLSEIDEEDDDMPTEEAPEGEEMSDMTDYDADKAVSEMSAEELMALIKDAVSQEFASQEGGMKMDGEGSDDYPEDDTEDGMPMGTKMGFGDEEEEYDEDEDEEDKLDEEIDLDELLNEVDAQFYSKSPVKKESTHGTYKGMRSENEKMKKQLAETRKAINVYKRAINESKLFASKSNALSKIFAKSNLSENQKRKIADKFDNCKTEGEVRIAYNVLKENLQPSFVKAKPSASKIIGSTKTVLKESNSGIISESLKARMQELAGIKKSI